MKPTDYVDKVMELDVRVTRLERWRIHAPMVDRVVLYVVLGLLVMQVLR